jgi:hypothetical protein
VLRSRREARRQAALAEIAELALANRDDRWLFERAAERIADHLDADAAVVFAGGNNGPAVASRWPIDAELPPGDDPGYETVRAACAVPAPPCFR